MALIIKAKLEGVTVGITILEREFLADTLLTSGETVGEAFAHFRLALEQHLRDLRLEPDPHQRALRIEHVAHELGEVQLHVIQSKMSSILSRERLVIDGTLLAFSLATTFNDVGLFSIPTLSVLAQKIKDVLDLRSAIRENPAYFLWQLKGKKESV